MAQRRASACQALVTAGGNEANELLLLKGSITVDDPTSRVTGHGPGFEAAYQRVLALRQLVADREGEFENYGGVINVDPKLNGDLRVMLSVLPDLYQAVRSNGIGGSQWNQLTDYSTDFSELAKLKCTG
jgi:hypothetical protein